MSGLLSGLGDVPRSLFLVVFLLLLTILGALWLDTQVPTSHDLKAIGNRPLEAALPLPPQQPASGAW
ncbi:hypothetical protein [Deinococcus ruber]|uniref:Uncharacterized protein n=1 Tax=Deinococcus ruber TaxID=1848197 RepID=A0A918F257_9DEIO|nr:hypothetical protein [Deinococcus ruber]GGQ94497.1 hypothetical protein GCM10008957_03310 [Deinococcus ruber]